MAQLTKYKPFKPINSLVPWVATCNLTIVTKVKLKLYLLSRQLNTSSTKCKTTSRTNKYNIRQVLKRTLSNKGEYYPTAVSQWFNNNKNCRLSPPKIATKTGGSCFPKAKTLF